MADCFRRLAHSVRIRKELSHLRIVAVHPLKDLAQ